MMADLSSAIIGRSRLPNVGSWQLPTFTPPRRTGGFVPRRGVPLPVAADQMRSSTTAEWNVRLRQMLSCRFQVRQRSYW